MLITGVNIYLLKYVVEANNFYYLYLPLIMFLNFIIQTQESLLLWSD